MLTYPASLFMFFWENSREVKNLQPKGLLYFFYRFFLGFLNKIFLKEKDTEGVERAIFENGKDDQSGPGDKIVSLMLSVLYSLLK